MSLVNPNLPRYGAGIGVPPAPSLESIVAGNVMFRKKASGNEVDEEPGPSKETKQGHQSHSHPNMSEPTSTMLAHNATEILSGMAEESEKAKVAAKETTFNYHKNLFLAQLSADENPPNPKTSPSPTLFDLTSNSSQPGLGPSNMEDIQFEKEDIGLRAPANFWHTKLKVQTPMRAPSLQNLPADNFYVVELPMEEEDNIPSTDTEAQDLSIALAIATKLSLKRPGEDDFQVEEEGMVTINNGKRVREDVGVDIEGEDHHFIHTNILEKEERTWWDCTFVYGNPSISNRVRLWNSILHLHHRDNTPWCVIGDYNEILFSHEKQGVRPANPGRLQVFREFLNEAELMDISVRGCQYTWSNHRDGDKETKEKLDRICANCAWRGLYPNAEAIAVPPSHLITAPLSWMSIQLGVAERILDLRLFGVIMKTVLKRSLSRWSKKTFKKAEKDVAGLKSQLTELLNSAPTLANQSRIQNLRKEIDEVWKQEEKFWGMRSRLKWVQWGDKNTKFFHSTTIQRRNKNRILRIKDNTGVWIEGTKKFFLR
ncbi:Endonuclease/exonuclease/phosphatase superfamily [Sesbania bispinosa]|nr:Endonuclease/exonuclease/phosphatase superfamily [Sesbania bispinosa]